jgi:tetratricopeptide (TPR) repeat protein
MSFTILRKAFSILITGAFVVATAQAWGAGQQSASEQAGRDRELFKTAIGDIRDGHKDAGRMELKKLQEARQAVQANPYSAEAQYKLGIVLEDDDKYQEAAQAFAEAIKLKPDYKDAYKHAAAAYHELKRFDDEIQTYWQYLSVNPDSVDMLHSLATALENRERYSEGIEVVRRIIELAPDDLNSRNQMGWFYIKMGRFDDAVAVLREQTALHPDSAIFTTTWGGLVSNCIDTKTH